jgi:hypothetical protein
VDTTGGPFTVYVVLDGLQDPGLPGDPSGEEEPAGIAAFEFAITFDEAVVAVEQAEAGPSLERTGRSFQCLPPLRDEPGTFLFGCVSPGAAAPGVQGSLTLASVTLRPVSAGSSTLLLESSLARPLGSEIPVDVIGGVVRVTGAPAPAPTTAPPSTVTRATVQPTVGGGGVPTPAPGGTVGPALASTALPSDGGETAAPSATLAPGGTRNPTDLVVNPGDFETPNGRSIADEGSSRSAVLWVAVGLGGLIALAAVGLVAALLRRRAQLGGA